MRSEPTLDVSSQHPGKLKANCENERGTHSKDEPDEKDDGNDDDDECDDKHTLNVNENILQNEINYLWKRKLWSPRKNTYSNKPKRSIIIRALAGNRHQREIVRSAREIGRGRASFGRKITTMVTTRQQGSLSLCGLCHLGSQRRGARENTFTCRRVRITQRLKTELQKKYWPISGPQIKRFLLLLLASLRHSIFSLLVVFFRFFLLLLFCSAWLRCVNCVFLILLMLYWTGCWCNWETRANRLADENS